MGCAMGSFGFDLTVQDVYEEVQRALPEAVYKGLTDDLTTGVPPQENNQVCWQYCADVMRITQEHANCWVLAPPGFATPTAGTFSPQVTVTWEGVAWDRRLLAGICVPGPGSRYR